MENTIRVRGPWHRTAAVTEMEGKFVTVAIAGYAHPVTIYYADMTVTQHVKEGVRKPSAEWPVGHVGSGIESFM